MSEATNEARKDLFLDSDYFRVLPADAWGMICSCCGEPRSKFTLLDFSEAERTIREAGGHEAMQLRAEITGKPVELPEPLPITICSLCWLYRSAWGKGRQTEIRDSLEEVAGTINVARHEMAIQNHVPVEKFNRIPTFKFDLNEDGVLTDVAQADRLLMQLVMASQVRQRAGTVVNGVRRLAGLRMPVQQFRMVS